MRLSILKKTSRSKTKFITLLLFIVGILVVALGLNAFLNFRSVSQSKLNLPGIDLRVEEEFTFNRFYNLNVSYPILNDEIFDHEVRRSANILKDDFLKKINSLPTKDSVANECDIDYQIHYYNDNFLSVSLNSRTMVAGKEVKKDKTLLYDRQNKKILKISDLFKKDTNYLAIISGQSKVSLERSLGSAYDADRASKGTYPKKNNFSDFIINKRRQLEIVYQEGQATSKKTGVVYAKIKTNTFADLLKDEFASNLLFTYSNKSAFLLPKDQLSIDPIAKLPLPQSKSEEIDCSSQKCIALTFDDGPAAPTARLLDILSANNARATFFVLGVQAGGYPGEMKRIVNDGHSIGNHTYMHSDLLSVSLEEAKNEIAQARNIISSMTGVTPTFARAPYGLIDDARARDLGLPFIGWTVDPLDWQNKNSGSIYEHVMSHASPGAVVLSHDIYGSTVDAYARIIPELSAAGYVFVTIPQLLGDNLEAGVYY